ncbi:hypothetical protein UlMin_034408 [Ulmus minor]
MVEEKLDKEIPSKKNGTLDPSIDDEEASKPSSTLQNEEDEEKGEVSKKKNKKKQTNPPPSCEQTDPPFIPVVDPFLEGEIQKYKDDNLWRTTSKEKRELEHLEKPMYNSVHRAVEVHRQVRKYIRSILKPGMLMTDLCETLENTIRKLISENGLEAGIAFPTRCSMNWVVAHWTPNLGDKTMLRYDDVMKLDFGTHIDAPPTLCFILSQTISCLQVVNNPILKEILESNDISKASYALVILIGFALNNNEMAAGSSHNPVLSLGAQSTVGAASMYGVTHIPGELECQYYIRTGDCKYGSSCRISNMLIGLYSVISSTFKYFSLIFEQVSYRKFMEL